MLSIANKERTEQDQQTFSLTTGAIEKKATAKVLSIFFIFFLCFCFSIFPKLYVVIKLLENSLTAVCEALKYISLHCFTSGFLLGHVHHNVNQNDALFAPKTHHKLRIHTTVRFHSFLRLH